MKIFHFTYIIKGTGKTEEEALESALEFFCEFPGEPFEVKNVTDQEAILNTISSENNWK